MEIVVKGHEGLIPVCCETCARSQKAERGGLLCTLAQPCVYGYWQKWEPRKESDDKSGGGDCDKA